MYQEFFRGRTETAAVGRRTDVILAVWPFRQSLGPDIVSLLLWGRDAEICSPVEQRLELREEAGHPIGSCTAALRGTVVWCARGYDERGLRQPQRHYDKGR